MSIIYVACGGAIGASLRYLIVSGVAKWTSLLFPLGTLCVNVVGSLIIGVVMAQLSKITIAHYQQFYTFWVVGILGGFTTFSAFSYDVVMLLQRQQLGYALLYIGGSVLLSLAAVLVGYYGIKIS